MDIFLNAFVLRLVSVCFSSRGCTVTKRLDGSRLRLQSLGGVPVWAVGKGKHGRRLVLEVGGRVGALAPNKFFHRPLQLSKFGGQRSCQVHSTSTLSGLETVLNHQNNKAVCPALQHPHRLCGHGTTIGKCLISQFQAINNVFV